MEIRRIIVQNETLIKRISAIIYFILLELIFCFVEVDLFSYAGFSWEPSIVKFIIGWILFIVGTLIVLKFDSRTISTAFNYMLFFMSIAPCIVLYQFEKTELWMIIYQMLLMIYIIWGEQFSCNRSCRNIKLPNASDKWFLFNGKQIKDVIFIVLMVFFIFSIIAYGIPSSDSLDFNSIYKVRADASFGLLESLLFNLMCKILLPIGIAFSLEDKKWIRTILLILLQSYIYMITGFKTYLFTLVIIFGFYILRKIPLQTRIIGSLAVGFFLGGLIYIITGNKMFVALLFNRTFFLPAKIKWAYMDFFSDNPFLYFADSTIGHILGISNSYDTPAVFMIGDKYFDSPDMWTNTGFLVDAYSNFGWIGGILIATFMIILLKWMDFATDKNDSGLELVIFILFFISMNDGGLISIAFSGGMIPAILILQYINKCRKVGGLRRYK